MDPMTRIEAGLNLAFTRTHAPPAPPLLAAAMRHAVFPRGARVRPRLCLAVAAACGDDHPEAADAAACAIEFLHCASLVHDDLPCFDDAATRRGKPSVHAAYGAPLAVLAGDALIVLAFQMDKTRIMTIMLNNDLSQMNMKFLDGVSGALHLDLTHNNHVPALEAMYLKTNQYHMREFTYLLDRMKAIDEGGQSMLDSSMMMLMSNLYDGDKHGADQMPIVIAGKAGGSLKTGRILDYLDKGDDNRRACSLYLSIMDRMGVQLDRFGDSEKRLAGL